MRFIVDTYRLSEPKNLITTWLESEDVVSLVLLAAKLGADIRGCYIDHGHFNTSHNGWDVEVVYSLAKESA